MAAGMLRRGLPRVKGGESWPPAAPAPGASVAGSPSAADVAESTGPSRADAVHSGANAGAGSRAGAPSAPEIAERTASERVDAVQSTETGALVTRDDVAGASGAGAALRRGLPRVKGGEPWPPAGAGAPSARDVAERGDAAAEAPNARDVAERTASERVDAVQSMETGALGMQAEAPGASRTGTTLRRGLPRVKGGEAWPPAGIGVPNARDVAERTASERVDAVQSTETGALETHSGARAAVRPDVSTPLPFRRTVWQGRAPRHGDAEPPASALRPTWPQAIAGLLGAAALGILAGAAVAFVRALLSLPFMQDFLAAFPGEYEPAIAVEPGFAPWVGWQHFFNMFLLVLIIRSGLRVRTEKRPTAFWAPRGNSKGKISLTLWFHQVLDLLWLINGVTFVVLIFVTGHWVRIVPTSWEVLPNALSAALQYVSFDWPHENGWNNYNSLQQLAYFITVFIAAPLAAVTGFRMSGLWPKSAERLSKVYPVEWARALHFPVMLYFVAFIVVHVALVMLTGFLRNLNHMYASQDAVTWTGFWVFVASLVVVVAGWIAARAPVLAPIARMFGNVSSR
ncbi:cytochrome b/b6 domain-containing protein [Microbacterium sp.]|uniref:cytochrome b/b6 domain-containing protein n=1 Tax=Microbacterium sp. TaxID=51671 RepID=UPI002811AF7F|nr:cytochrome b/b6 domain-containing protein [Microbacterium sp.]